MEKYALLKNISSYHNY